MAFFIFSKCFTWRLPINSFHQAIVILLKNKCESCGYAPPESAETLPTSPSSSLVTESRWDAVSFTSDPACRLLNRGRGTGIAFHSVNTCHFLPFRMSSSSNLMVVHEAYTGDCPPPGFGPPWGPFGQHWPRCLSWSSAAVQSCSTGTRCHQLPALSLAMKDMQDLALNFISLL